MAEWTDEKESQLTTAIESLTKMNEAYEKLQKQVEGQETVTQQYKQEMGDARKQMEEISSIPFDEIKKSVDENRKMLENTNKIVQDGVTKPETDVLTQEQKSNADTVFKQLDEEQRRAIKTDPEKKKQFLEAAKLAPASVKLDSLFDEEVATPKANEFAKLFGVASNEADFTPAGGNNVSSSGYADADNLTGKVTINPDNRRLAGGQMPRPKVAAS